MRKAVYPGSFDPPTLGHLDVIERAARQFDEVIVAIGINRAKTPFLEIEDRICALERCVKTFSNVKIDSFEGLLVAYVRSKGATAIVRGLRATSDFDYEFQIAMANRRMDPTIETIFLMTKDEHSFLSSTVVREVAVLGGNYQGFVPPEVAEIIGERLREKS